LEYLSPALNLGEALEDTPLTDQIARGGAQPNHTELTADIVSAYVTNNSIRPADLPELIGSVHAALRNVTSPAPRHEERPTPPVNPKKTVSPDYLISLEDGRRYKTLKRHLKGRGLTPEQYKNKWGLPHDYPMVAPNYAKTRSDLAKQLGLGKMRSTVAHKAVAVVENVSNALPKKRRARKG
jgi:predicted transcriptional regulator